MLATYYIYSIDKYMTVCGRYPDVFALGETICESRNRMRLLILEITSAELENVMYEYQLERLLRNANIEMQGGE